MGGKNKIKRFEENRTFGHFFQVPFSEAMQGFRLRGKWRDAFFHNDHPLVLELGCGKGEYTVGLARRYPKKNFIGVDIKGARMWRGAKTSWEEGLRNVAFLRTRIELIGYFFDAAEVNEIWITFPDPHPRHSRQRKRLTHPVFLERYRNFLDAPHLIHLKTDDPGLYSFTREVVTYNGYDVHQDTPDLYRSGLQEEASQIQTFYEQMWLEQEKPIHYLRFTLAPDRQALAPPSEDPSYE